LKIIFAFRGSHAVLLGAPLRAYVSRKVDANAADVVAERDGDEHDSVGPTAAARDDWKTNETEQNFSAHSEIFLRDHQSFLRGHEQGPKLIGGRGVSAPLPPPVVLSE